MSIIFRENMPTLDLHGEDKITARIKVIEFINDSHLLGRREIAIIHGIGKGILKKEVFKVLKENKKVVEFKTDYFNLGCTLVKISDGIDKKDNLCYNTRHKLKGEI